MIAIVPPKNESEKQFNVHCHSFGAFKAKVAQNWFNPERVAHYENLANEEKKAAQKLI